MTDYRKWMRPAAGTPLPRGDYVAYVEASAIRWINAQATLSLRLVCKSKTRMRETVMDFMIHQRDQKEQWHERRRLMDVAAAMGVYQCDDSDQLHGLPFRMTIWRSDPMRVSFRPASGGGGAGVERGLVDGGGPGAA